MLDNIGDGFCACLRSAREVGVVVLIIAYKNSTARGFVFVGHFHYS